MRSISAAAVMLLSLLLTVQLLCFIQTRAEPESGTVIPAESKPYLIVSFRQYEIVEMVYGGYILRISHIYTKLCT